MLALGGKHEALGVIDGLENGTHYMLNVACINASGEGASATTKEFVPKAAAK